LPFPNGKLLIAAGEAAEIVVWEMPLPQPRGRLRGHVETVRSLAFSPDSRTLATGDLNGVIKLWSLEWFGGQFAVRELVTLREHHDSVERLQFSPDGTILASASGDGAVRFWRAEPEL
jgi:WD40 repeat protein